MENSGKKSSSRVEPDDVGFIFGDGQVVGLNPSPFARYFAKRLTLCFSSEELFYRYKAGVFLLLKEAAVKSELYSAINGVVADSWRPSFENGCMQALRNLTYSAEPMNSRKNLINLNNCMLDINTLETVAHDPRFRSTVRIPLTYDPAAECPRFEKYLEEVFEGDHQRIAIAEEILGYCLTTQTRAQKAFLLVGSGLNGKSVFCEILRQLCGQENVSGVSLGEMKNSFARLDLVNKTVNLVTETEVSGSSFNTEFFKSIVAGDAIRVEVKHGPSFTVTPTVKIVAAMNALPFAKDQSYGLMRRLLILPFERQFTGKEVNVNLVDELKGELAGIFNLAIRGLQRLRAQEYRFTQSSKVDAALAEYRESISPISTFVDEIIEQGDALHRERNRTIWRLFEAWCKDRGHNKIAEMTENRFHGLLKNALRDKKIDFRSEKSGGERFLSGVALSIQGKTELRLVPGYGPAKTERVSANVDLEAME